MLRESCLVCGSRQLATVMDLGLHPFADTFLKPEELSGDEVYPLVCDLCEDCGQVQLKHATDPKERYVRHDYSYTSSNSEFSRKHWREYAAHVAEKVSLSQNGFVVEIGSNDGFLAEQFLRRGNPVLGVDASPCMAALARTRGIETKVGLFGSVVSREIREAHGAAELIVANNVFNHSDDPIDFIRGAADLLDEGGTFVFELPYWRNAVRNKKFDQIYHEHVTYFTVTGSERILRAAGLGLVDVELVAYHGGSLRIYGRRGKQICTVAKELAAEERREELFDSDTYRVFMKEIHAKRRTFLNRVAAIKKQNGKIIAVGAAAKGNTLLNFYNLDNRAIEFVTDSSAHKQGKYTPYSRIPICGDEVFANYDQPYALILSWNISEQLKRSLLSINPKIRFLSPWTEEE